MPPLRQHLEDVPELIAAFLDRWRRANPGLVPPSFSESAVEALSERSWPGNVRELEHVVYRLASSFGGCEVDADAVQTEAEQSGVSEQRLEAGLKAFSKTRLDDVERDTVVRALIVANGNKTTAARLLGVSRKTVYHKIEQYGIKVG